MTRTYYDHTYIYIDIDIYYKSYNTAAALALARQERVQQRIPRRDPLGRIELQALFEQVDKAEQLLELVVLHLDLDTRGREQSRAEIAGCGCDDQRFECVLQGVSSS